MSMIDTRAWQAGHLTDQHFPLADVSEHLAESDTIVWVDLCQPDDAALALLAAELGLHELAVEDALSEHQRPKLDEYDTHLFLSCHAVRVEPPVRLATVEIDAFIGDHWLVTVRKDPSFDMAPVCHRWERSEALVGTGVAGLVYGLLDVVVDDYFDAVNAFDDYYDDVSEGLFADQPLDPHQQRDWFEARRALVKLHRLVAPMREVVSSLVRHDRGAVPAEVAPYFQDVYDHVLRVTESLDALRDLVGTIVETNLSLRDYHQNQIMKKVTSWAAIIAVPTLVTGYYGMNVPYPGFARHWGFVVSVVVMVVMVGVLWTWFRRLEWL